MTWALFPEERYLKGVIELLDAGQRPPGPERIMAVVGGALLEEAVERTVRERLINEPSMVDRLVDTDKPLGNMGPQIDLLRCLGAIDEQTRSALQGIARIRNFFAHNLDASFDSLDTKFLRHFKQLALHEGRTHYPHHLFGPDSTTPLEPILTKRDIFVVNLKIALILLMRNRVGHVPWQASVPKSEVELLKEFPHRYADTGLPPG